MLGQARSTALSLSCVCQGLVLKGTHGTGLWGGERRTFSFFCSWHPKQTHATAFLMTQEGVSQAGI